MKISYNWLKTLIHTELSPEDISQLLTNAGLEVESIEAFENVKGGLDGIVIGEVVECAKHPDADKLSLTKVNVGNGDLLSIVCGAPNVAKGQKVVVAMVGCTLYPSEGEPFKIKKSKIRGEVSEGMLCAEDEIGIGQSHAGIIVLPDHVEIGQKASSYYEIEKDFIFEIGLTPNRSDATSHYGVARELAAILNSNNEDGEATAHVVGAMDLPKASETSDVQIEVRNTDACKRYSGLVINGVTVGPSPEWLQNRLKSIGLRPINNVVDVTNFVLHELGQPLHAFDMDAVKGNKVVVDLAKEGDQFITLDGEERKLKSFDLMISNEEEHMCIAGVFGGEKSGVTESTKAVFLESAYFSPEFIRKTAKAHGLKTDASFRFERGTDPEMTVTALVRAANLILEIAGGKISMDIKDIYPEKLEPFKVAFSYNQCNELIGQVIDKITVKRILTSLGISIEQEGSDGLLLDVPRYKADVTRPADVIEEILRIYGYNRIDVSPKISYTAFDQEKDYNRLVEEKIAALLVNNGFQETMNLSLNKGGWYKDEESLVKLVNPLSGDLNVLRGNLIYGGLQAIAYNLNRKNERLKFYEIGKSYELIRSDSGNDYKETKCLSLWIGGSAFPDNAFGLNYNSDFFIVKNYVESILGAVFIDPSAVEESENRLFDYGLKIKLKKNAFAEFGAVNTALLKEFDIRQPVFYATIDWDALVQALRKNTTVYKPVPQFPIVKRDLALLLDKKVRYKELYDLAFQAERKLLKEVQLFDIYQDAKLGDKKSYALRFTLLNEEATLTDKQIDKVMEKIAESYKEKLNAQLR